MGRVASMSLIAAVTAAGVVNDDTKRIFAEEVVRVGQDNIYWVRREAAYALGALAKVVTLEVLNDALVRWRTKTVEISELTDLQRSSRCTRR